MAACPAMPADLRSEAPGSTPGAYSDPDAAIPHEPGRHSALRIQAVDVSGLDFDRVASAVGCLVSVSHGLALSAGWWTDLRTGADLRGRRNVGEALCLVHSEVSEAMEAYRKGLRDDKLPHRPGIEVELADAMIRIADLAGGLGLDLGGAVAEKLAYNAVRADHRPENRLSEGGKAF